MKVAGLHHVAICVNDLGEALTFYKEGLGFELVERPDFEFPGAWIQAGANQIHLMEMACTPDRAQHFALQVEDVESAADELEARGLKVRRSPHFEGAGRQIFLRDPSGNRIELNQPDVR